METTNQVSHPPKLDLQAINTALSRVQALIEFHLDCTIIHANENFLDTRGYMLYEVRGKHHAMFCDAAYTVTPAYRQFWPDLAPANSTRPITSASPRMVRRSGSMHTTIASWIPTAGLTRRSRLPQTSPLEKMRNAEFEGKITAIYKAQAVIEFNLDGTVITANANFLATMGVTLDEIRGKHHRIFCDPDDARSLEYARFWRKLGGGESDSGEYKRVASDGREIWLNASYNPIFDANGNPLRNEMDAFRLCQRCCDESARTCQVNKGK